jgi:hypothetical protein
MAQAPVAAKLLIISNAGFTIFVTNIYGKTEFGWFAFMILSKTILRCYK